MKKPFGAYRYGAAVMVGLLAAVAAVAASFPARYRYEVATTPPGCALGSCVAAQACSANVCNASAPSSATDGMGLGGCVGAKLTICAASGQTLSGTGTMFAWLFKATAGGGAGLWARHQLDMAVPAAASGNRCFTFDDIALFTQIGDRLRYTAGSVGVSGGSTLDVMLECQLGTAGTP